jgi:sugar lactone lactonase YvrE
MRSKPAVSAKLMLTLLTCLAAPAASVAAPNPHSLAPGQVRHILRMTPLVDVMEGIAIDRYGHIFVSRGRLESDRRVCDILERAPDGTTSVFVTLDRHTCNHPAGLAFDAHGNLYEAGGFDRNGSVSGAIWRIRRNGETEILAGSRRMVFANALAFDSQGNLYATDSVVGEIWRFPPGERGRLWIRDPLLAPDPAIGANGIAFVPPNNLYVANLDRALIALIRIRPDGRPSEPEIAAAGYELLGIDGLTADAHGTLYAVIVVSKVLGTAPLVMVDPKTGRITPSTAPASAFDLPTSPAVGRGPLDHKSVFVVNSGFFPEERVEAAPGVVQVGVGVKDGS